MTDTVATPAASPAAAVTSATPGPVAVTSPDESTAATRVSELAHDRGSSRHRPPHLVQHLRRQLHGRAQRRQRCGRRAHGHRRRNRDVDRDLRRAGHAAGFGRHGRPRPRPHPSPARQNPPSPPAYRLRPTRTCAPATAWPFASNASAVNRSVSAVTREAAPGVTVTAFVACATVISALAVAAPDVAVTVVSPFATAVASPRAVHRRHRGVRTRPRHGHPRHHPAVLVQH